jgi:porin
MDGQRTGAIERLSRLAAAACLCVAAAAAQDQAAKDEAAKPEAAAETKGILPVPDYSGDVWSRLKLTGDWGGKRQEWADEGVQISVDWNQWVQGVTNGGRSEHTLYGGQFDYLVYIDLMRMGVMDGALIKFRAQSRYGETINPYSGLILPANFASFYPIDDRPDEDVQFAVSDLNLTQFLSSEFAVVVGKIDTADGDPNEFASGRGTSQFMNFNLIFNPVLALRLPYSTLGAGAVWLPVQDKDRGFTLVNMLFNTVDSSTSSGFNDFGDGLTWNGEADWQYRLDDLPGGTNLGALYSWNQDFTEISGQFTFIPGQGVSIPQTNHTWALYWSAWQYLTVKNPVDEAINLSNGIADREGVGLFTRVGIADQDTNPIKWSASGGLGGRGGFGDRPNDTYGVGYYYTALESDKLSGFVGVEDHTQGVEAYYTLGFTPAVNLTFDLQYVTSAADALDDATIAALRLGLKF